MFLPKTKNPKIENLSEKKNTNRWFFIFDVMDLLEIAQWNSSLCHIHPFWKSLRSNVICSKYIEKYKYFLKCRSLNNCSDYIVFHWLLFSQTIRLCAIYVHKQFMKNVLGWRYQYNTGSHGSPRFHSLFDPKFLDCRGSTNFCSHRSHTIVRATTRTR